MNLPNYLAPEPPFNSELHHIVQTRATMERRGMDVFCACGHSERIDEIKIMSYNWNWTMDWLIDHIDALRARSRIAAKWGSAEMPAGTVQSQAGRKK